MGDQWRNIIDVNTFLKKVDLGINGFKIEPKKLPEGPNLPSNIPTEIKDQILKELSKEAVFYHETDYGELARFTSNQESKGVQQGYFKYYHL